MSQEYTDEAGKIKHNDNPFIEPVQSNTVVDMKGGFFVKEIVKNSNFVTIVDVMVLNDIIEQAAGRHSRASDHGGMFTCQYGHVISNAF